MGTGPKWFQEVIPDIRFGKQLAEHLVRGLGHNSPLSV